MKTIRSIFLFLVMPFLFMGCSVLKIDSSEWEGMAIIVDSFGGPTVKEIDGKPPKRMSHEIHTLVPNVYVKPGFHVFKIENDKNGLLTGGEIEIVEITAVLEEATYEIVEENGTLILQKKKSTSANKAELTMSANARPFLNDPMKINPNSLGTSVEADIVSL